MDKEYAVKLILGNQYYSIDDLRHNQKLGFMLSREDFAEFLAIKDLLVSQKDALTEALPLKSFNSKHIFYVNGPYLLLLYKDYLRILNADSDTNYSSLFARHAETMVVSRLFSEIEGTLNIENVPTTRRRITDIFEKKELKD